MKEILDFVCDDGFEAVTVEEHPEPVSQPATGATHVLVAPEDWGWEELRDYVVKQVQFYHGVQRRDPVKEKSIFQAFARRWGADAVPIAKFAFEVRKGVWHSSPITVNRFCQGSDEYFAAAIARHLHK